MGLFLAAGQNVRGRSNKIPHQAGVIAYRDKYGKLEVLLITSRDTGRWIIPKGNISAYATPAKAAVKEAYEEAGIKGTVPGSVPLGFYTYFKRLDLGQTLATTVEASCCMSRSSLRNGPRRANGNWCGSPPKGQSSSSTSLA